mmetsp:Transcript_4684/g.7264  ORF Transcript_4684/g.7264 Transcript_4684/m.7264 type:complete len:605 (+) Transcript_4684:253-2067(+)
MSPSFEAAIGGMSAVNMARPVFLSYANKDSDWVNRFYASLEKDQYLHGKIWRDKECLTNPSNWREESLAAIQSCRAVICVISKSYFESDQCKAEAANIESIADSLSGIYLLRLDSTPVPRAYRWMSTQPNAQNENFSNDSDYYRMETKFIATLTEHLKNPRRSMPMNGMYSPSSFTSDTSSTPHMGTVTPSKMVTFSRGQTGRPGPATGHTGNTMMSFRAPPSNAMMSVSRNLPSIAQSLASVKMSSVRVLPSSFIAASGDGGGGGGGYNLQQGAVTMPSRLDFYSNNAANSRPMADDFRNVRMPSSALAAIATAYLNEDQQSNSSPFPVSHMFSPSLAAEGFSNTAPAILANPNPRRYSRARLDSISSETTPAPTPELPRAKPPTATPQRPPIRPPVNMAPLASFFSSLARHPNVTCQKCKLPVFGLRFKCESCSSWNTYDICPTCYSSGEGAKHAMHKVVVQTHPTAEWMPAQVFTPTSNAGSSGRLDGAVVLKLVTKFELALKEPEEALSDWVGTGADKDVVQFSVSYLCGETDVSLAKLAEITAYGLSVNAPFKVPYATVRTLIEKLLQAEGIVPTDKRLEGIAALYVVGSSLVDPNTRR